MLPSIANASNRKFLLFLSILLVSLHHPLYEGLCSFVGNAQGKTPMSAHPHLRCDNRSFWLFFLVFFLVFFLASLVFCDLHVAFCSSFVFEEHQFKQHQWIVIYWFITINMLLLKCLACSSSVIFGCLRRLTVCLLFDQVVR